MPKTADPRCGDCGGKGSRVVWNDWAECGLTFSCSCTFTPEEKADRDRFEALSTEEQWAEIEGYQAGAARESDKRTERESDE